MGLRNPLMPGSGLNPIPTHGSALHLRFISNCVSRVPTPGIETTVRPSTDSERCPSVVSHALHARPMEGHAR